MACFKGDDDKTITTGRSDKKAFLISEQASKVSKVEITLEPKDKSELIEAQLIQLSFSGKTSLLGKSEVAAGSNTCVISIKEDKITEDKPCVVKIRINTHKRGRNPNPMYVFITEGRYERSVIFPGTMWVFMRHFTKMSPASSVWDRDDRTAYENQMKDSIRELLER